MALLALARRRLGRYAITGESMIPTLAPGDYVIAIRGERRPPREGQVVLALDPREPARTIAKRVAALAAAADGDRVALLGDNAARSTDSRAFGPVPRSSLRGRVVWRYWPPARFGPVR